MNVVAVKTFAAERWNQRRVNVDDFVLEVAWDLNKTEEPSEDHKIDFGFAAKIKDSIVRRLQHKKTSSIEFDQRRNVLITKNIKHNI